MERAMTDPIQSVPLLDFQRVSDEEKADLWECLYLSMPQVEALLKDVKRFAAFPFIHPMFCFAAYTGARRSEMIRSQIGDIDFENKVITLRETKRVRIDSLCEANRIASRAVSSLTPAIS